MTNYGIIGNVEAKSITMGKNITVNVSEKWDTIDKWLDKNKSNIMQYDELTHQINTLQTKILSEEQKESIYTKIRNIIGSVADSSQILTLLKELI